jgi:hypothetical protein
VQQSPLRLQAWFALLQPTVSQWAPVGLGLQKVPVQQSAFVAQVSPLAPQDVMQELFTQEPEQQSVPLKQ